MRMLDEMSDSCLGVYILVYCDPREDLLIIEWISFGPKNACPSQFPGDGISVNQESYSCMFSWKRFSMQSVNSARSYFERT